LVVFSVIHGSCFSVQLRSLSGSPFASFGVGIFPSTCAWLVFRTLQPRMAHDMHSLSAFHFVRLLRETVALFFFAGFIVVCTWCIGSDRRLWLDLPRTRFLHVEILFASRSMDSGSVFIYVWCEFHAVHSFQFVLLVVCRVSCVESKISQSIRNHIISPRLYLRQYQKIEKEIHSCRARQITVTALATSH
jgi:hypothetical protein